jgi:hypothetical protein
MPSRTARLALVGAALVVLVVAFVVAQGSDDDGPTASLPAQTTTAPAQGTVPTATTPAPKPRPRPEPPLLTAGKVTSLEVRKGATVRFRARSASDDHVHVHGYDLMKEAPAGRTVSMAFKADIEGVFEIELEDAGTQIASLKVEP